MQPSPMAETERPVRPRLRCGKLAMRFTPFVLRPRGSLAGSQAASSMDPPGLRPGRAPFGSGLGRNRNALVLHQGGQLAGLEHLHDDVAAADELAADIELRDGRPVG